MKLKARASILYLDDEQTSLDVFRLTFCDEYLVHTARTAEEARRSLAAEGPFDVIISDQVMPELDGATFLREAEIASPESYRVLLTGSVGVGECFGQIASGTIQLFIAKPWSEDHMRRVLELAESSARIRKA